MTPWRSIDTIPTDRAVIVKSAHGTECLARAKRAQVFWVTLPGKEKQQRVSCVRADGVKRGEISAAAWREVESSEDAAFIKAGD